MGLLDDAIREHLELMRRRGADPTEIAKAEAEALSPPVREVEEPESHSEDGELPAGNEPVPAAELEDLETDLAADGDELPTEQETEHFDVLAASEVAEGVAIEEGDLDDPSLRSPDAETEAHELDFEDDLEFDQARSDDEEEPPTEIDGQQALPGVESDDVLEGTPEFLSDSPDHDKLWFEQSGPRDFDFDGEDGK